MHVGGYCATLAQPTVISPHTPSVASEVVASWLSENDRTLIPCESLPTALAEAGADSDDPIIVVAGFRAHQELLRRCDGDHAEPFEPSFTLAHVTAAMTDRHGSKGQAKQLQLLLADGRPLTVCSGTGKYLPKHRVETMVQGCGLVFPDTTRAEGGGRSYWLRWCPDHQARKHPERTLLPAHLRLRTTALGLGSRLAVISPRQVPRTRGRPIHPHGPRER